MRRRIGWIAGGMAAALALGITMSRAEETPPSVIEHSFEENIGGWTGFGASAKVALTKEAGSVKVGKGALQFDYAVKKGEMNMLLLPTGDGTLTKMKSLSFWVKATHSTPLIVTLGEKEGGRYNASAFVPKDTWQKVELATSDFVVATGKDDPKDPNNKLDLDQVENLGISDLSQILAQSEDPNFTKLLNVQTGPHMLTFDEFNVSEKALPDAMTTEKDEVLLDKLIRPQLAWFGFGSAQVSRVTEKPLDGVSVKVDFRQEPNTIMGLARGVKPGALANTKELRFTAASSKLTTLYVQLEESEGGKYNATIELPGNSEKKEFTLVFADFKPSDDSNDANGKLDLDKVQQIIFFDISGLTGAVSQENTLWINSLRATK